MTAEQKKLVENNMGLVGKVIKDKVHGIGQNGAYSYEDLFQIGCIGLCKAAVTDKGGCFSTYAYRLIWNEICDELIRVTRLAQREQNAEVMEALTCNAQDCADPFEKCSLQHILEQAKSMAQGATAKGIRCLELTSQGYSSQEIGTIVQAEAATVRMWMTKARRFLRSLPELRDYVCLEVA